MRTINDHGDLVECCFGDTLCLWVAQGLDGRSSAWASEDGRAVAVAGPALSGRDRLAVWGPSEAVIPLVCRVLPEAGPSFRPLGDRALIDTLVAAVPELVPVGSFGLMTRRMPVAEPPLSGSVEWVPGSALPEVGRLIQSSFPDSYAKPGVRGVERWAGVRDDLGRLVAVGALAWSAPTVGFLSGVAVHPDHRGVRLGRRVADFLVVEALQRSGAAALMVDDRNHAAIRLYEGLGLRYQPMRAAAVRH